MLTLITFNLRCICGGLIALVAVPTKTGERAALVCGACTAEHEYPTCPACGGEVEAVEGVGAECTACFTQWDTNGEHTPSVVAA